MSKTSHKKYSAERRAILEQIHCPISEVSEFKVSDLGGEEGYPRNLYRNINHWSNKGLLLQDRKGSEWRTFSLVEFIWILILQELRSVGFSINKIKGIRDKMVKEKSINDWLELIDLHAPPLEAKNTGGEDPLTNFIKGGPMAASITSLGAKLARIIHHREPIFLIVFTGGTFDYVDPDFFAMFNLRNTHDIRNRTYISVPLHSLLVRVLKDERFEPLLPHLEILNENELEVIRELRKGNLSSIELIMDGEDGVTRIESQEILEGADPQTKLCNLLLVGGYQDISFTTQNGKIVKFTRTTKKKLK